MTTKRKQLNNFLVLLSKNRPCKKQSLMDLIKDNLSLEDVKAMIDVVEKQLGVTKNNLEKLKRQSYLLHMKALELAQIEYFNLYGEYDVDVRTQYMDLVKSCAHDYPYQEDDLGYPAELCNITSLNNSSGTNINARSSMTEFIKIGNMPKCKITTRIKDAFMILKYEPKLEGRGLAIHAQPVTWAEFNNSGKFDYSGYLAHLQTS